MGSGFDVKGGIRPLSILLSIRLLVFVDSMSLDCVQSADIYINLFFYNCSKIFMFVIILNFSFRISSSVISL